jgi:hypothetical protein
MVYRYLAAAQAGTLAPKNSWGHWRKLDPQKLPVHVQAHPDATLKELQRVFTVSHHAVWVRLRQLGFTLKKKLTKYRERNEVQRWLFRRELENLTGRPVFYRTNAVWITACIVSMAVRLGANGFIRPWRAKGGNAPASLPLRNRASWWPRWGFKAVATRRWWTLILKRCSCQRCHRTA